MKDGQASTGSHVVITGGVAGQVAIGQQIQQSSVSVQGSPPTADELAELKRALDDLRALVSAEAPTPMKDAAIERVDELHEAITADAPDLSTMEYVKRWFAKHLPKLAGLVTGVIVNPIVGKLVAASGEALAEEFRQRFERD